MTIITRTFGEKKIMLFPPFNMFCSKIGREIEREEESSNLIGSPNL